jgi:hypothetical protein
MAERNMGESAGRPALSEEGRAVMQAKRSIAIDEPPGQLAVAVKREHRPRECC